MWKMWTTWRPPSTTPNFVYRDAPDLVGHVRFRRWEKAMKRVASFPNEATYIDPDGYSALHYACAQRAPVEVVRSLLDANPRACLARNRWGKTPLHVACKFHDSSCDLIRTLLEADPSAANVRDKEDQTPLGVLCTWSSDLVSEALSSKNVPLNLNSRDDSFKDFWCKACLLLRANHRGSIGGAVPSEETWDVVRACIECRCPPNLLKLAANLYPDQVRRLDEDGNSPLHQMAAAGYDSSYEREEFDAVAFLLSSHPEAARLKNRGGKLPLHLALRGGRVRWEGGGVSALVGAFPEALGIFDEETLLLPFMLAAVGRDADIDCVYRLLRMRPELEMFVR